MSDSIQLSEEETKEINKVMKQNNDDKNEVLIGNKDPISKKEYQEALHQAKEVYRHIKKRLKPLPKNELINIIVKYSSDLQEMQNIAAQLLEENNKLKEAKKENS